MDTPASHLSSPVAAYDADQDTADRCNETVQNAMDEVPSSTPPSGSLVSISDTVVTARGGVPCGERPVAAALPDGNHAGDDGGGMAVAPAMSPSEPRCGNIQHNGTSTFVKQLARFCEVRACACTAVVVIVAVAIVVVFV